MVLALAFDALRIALAHAGMLSERRMNKNPLRYPAPETFVAAVAGGRDDVEQSIAGPLTFTAAAVVSLLKHLAAPVTLECPPVEADVEDHATLAPLAVMLARQSLHHLETLLAIEALLAVEALDHRPTLPRLGAGTHAAYETVRDATREAGPAAPSPVLVETVRRALMDPLGHQPSWLSAGKRRKEGGLGDACKEVEVEERRAP
jgi:histidine ammonia-lyase